MELKLIKCFNVHCVDHDAEADNGCYFSDFPEDCNFTGKIDWRTKMEDGKKGGVSLNSVCGRMSAGAVLDDKIKRCQKEVDGLKALKYSIDWNLLSKEDEEVLWHLFSSRRIY